MLIKDQLVIKKNIDPGTMRMWERYQVDTKITEFCMHNIYTTTVFLLVGSQ